VVASAQTEASPAIEPSHIPDVAAGKQGKEAKGKTETLAVASPAPTAAIAGADTLAPAVGGVTQTAAAKQSAAGSPANPSDMPAAAMPSLSPTVETPVAAAEPLASVIASAATEERTLPKASATAPLTDRTASSPAAAKEPVIAA